MYGLKQAAILSYNLIKQCLAPAGYYPIKESNGLWKHKTRKTILALTIDSFGIKYFNKHDAIHLIKASQKYYEISINYDGNNYYGYMLNWNCKKDMLMWSMPGYVYRSLASFNHIKPTRFHHTSHHWNQPVYERKVQYAKDEDKLAKLDAKGKKLIQKLQEHFYTMAEQLKHLPW